LEGRFIDQVRKKDSSLVCYDRYDDLPSYDTRYTSLGFEGGGQNTAVVLLVGLQRCQGRTLSGGLGKSMPSYENGRSCDL
jgi:hypothetical protein